ncbi:hypothetical protein SLEP1_g16301 [Rubroshorea leprosula]|uniref:Alcohol dehydrogenase-like N-terminal domain-containing protein n=1 Tax=Rubroshorea leprosula TaxID=152421 RepID=A0AAV5J0W5_9ROSI|nr:hypothetical protein SLEP1_g16301 [Rubroshorea leprosula]
MWMGGFVRKNMESSVALGSIFSRYMSRSRAVNVRKINPKVPIEEAKSIAHSLYDIIRQHGPLSISNTWIQAKEAGISGLNSKTHMKIMLKWMRGRKMLKLLCNHVGNNKKFLHYYYFHARHEIAGIVKEVGSNVHRFKVGDHVGVGTYVNSCRDCESCNESLENYCLKGSVFTFNAIDADGTITKGGYSSHIVVHER